MKKFKPTAEHVALIKQCAVREAEYAGYPGMGPTQILLEPGIRCNTEINGKPIHMNIAMVTDLEGWGDTDLHDFGQWSAFRDGVELTPGGDGIFDFYLKGRNDPDNQLISNLIVYVKQGKMDRIDGASRTAPIWSRED